VSDCIHDLALGTCSLCARPRVPAGRRLIEEPAVRTVRARHAGDCLRCDGPIEEGTLIAFFDGVWIHADHFADGMLL